MFFGKIARRFLARFALFFVETRVTTPSTLSGGLSVPGSVPGFRLFFGRIWVIMKSGTLFFTSEARRPTGARGKQFLHSSD